MHTQNMRRGSNKLQSKYNFICFINLECGTDVSGLSGSPAAPSCRMLSILYFCKMCYQLGGRALEWHDILIKKISLTPCCVLMQLFLYLPIYLSIRISYVLLLFNCYASFQISRDITISVRHAQMPLPIPQCAFCSPYLSQSGRKEMHTWQRGEGRGAGRTLLISAASPSLCHCKLLPPPSFPSPQAKKPLMALWSFHSISNTPPFLACPRSCVLLDVLCEVGGLFRARARVQWWDPAGRLLKVQELTCMDARSSVPSCEDMHLAFL